MNCKNCGQEAPDGFKFCPFCGQPAPPPEPPAPKVCSACGLQLEPNAKFCAVCGTPVGAAAAKPVQPAAPVQQPVAPVQSVQPIPTAQPAPTFATVPEAAEQPAKISLSKTAPQPAPFTQPAAQPAAFSEPAPQSAPFPQPAASYTAPDYSGAAVVPVKKNGSKIGLIIGIAAAVIVAVLAVVFLFNKGPVMNLVLGDKGYAALIEKQTVSAITDAAGNPAVATGVQSMSEAFSASASNNLEDIEDVAELNSIDYRENVNLSAMVGAAKDYMEETYGSRSVEFMITPELSLTETSKNLMTEGESISAEELDEIVSLIADSVVSGSVTADDKLLGALLAYTNGNFRADIQVTASDDGKVYVSCPFASETALLVPVTVEEVKEEVEAPALSIDEKEIRRLAEAIGDVYLEYYKNGEVTVEKKGELLAAGVKAEGKLITVKIGGEDLKAMLAEIGKTIAEDEYFCTKIVEYANDCGEAITAEDYKKEITEAFDKNPDPDDYLEVKTVVNKNNDVLAKSYIANDAEDNLSFTYINGEETAAFEAAVSDAGIMSANISKTDKENGVINLKFSDGESSPLAIKVQYSDFKSEKFLNGNTATGKLVITVTPPADFTTDSNSAELYAAISGADITITTAVENEKKFTESIIINVPQYGMAGITFSVSASDDKKLSVPTDVIDLSAMTDDSGETDLSEEDYQRLEKFGNDILEALTSSDSKISELIASLTETSEPEEIPTVEPDEPVEPTPPQTNVDTTGLCNRISDIMTNLNTIWIDYGDVVTEEIDETAAEYSERLFEIYFELIDGSVTADEFGDFTAEVNELEKKISALLDEVIELNGGEIPSNEYPEYDEETFDWGFDFNDYEIEPLPEFNYSNMSYDEFIECAVTLENHYLSLSLYYVNDISGNDELLSLFDEATESYNDMLKATEKLCEAVNDGNLSVPLLREACKTARAFDEDLRTLENRLTELVGAPA